MKLIDLNLQTLFYADLTQKTQRVSASAWDCLCQDSIRQQSGIISPCRWQAEVSRHCRISERRSEGNRCAAARGSGQAYQDDRIDAEAFGIPAPDIYTGRVLEALSLSGVFRSGVVLIGTTAYQLYPCVVGAYLDETATRTQDADLALARLAVAKLTMAEPLDVILRRADELLAPHYSGKRQDAQAVSLCPDRL